MFNNAARQHQLIDSDWVPAHSGAVDHREQVLRDGLSMAVLCHRLLPSDAVPGLVAAYVVAPFMSFSRARRLSVYVPNNPALPLSHAGPAQDDERTPFTFLDYDRTSVKDLTFALAELELGRLSDTKPGLSACLHACCHTANCLHTLDLQRCDHGGLVPVTSVLCRTACQTLTWLDISETATFGDALLTAVGEARCPVIRLDASSTRGSVTDAGVEAVAKAGALAWLGVALTFGCVTDFGLLAVSRLSPDLEFVDVRSTDGAVTEYSLGQLREDHGAALRIEADVNLFEH